MLLLQEICLLRVLSFDPNMVQFYGACWTQIPQC